MSHSRSPTYITTATEKEARRVLEWQDDVARSTASSEAPPEVPKYRRSETFPMTAPSTYTVAQRDNGGRLQRRETTGLSSSTRERNEAYENRERGTGSQWGSDNIWGVSNKVVGTFLGAAAGAVVAYAMVSSESSKKEREARRRSSVGGVSRSGGVRWTYEDKVDPLAYGQGGELYAERRGLRPGGRAETLASGDGREREREIPGRYIEYTTMPGASVAKSTSKDLETIAEKSTAGRSRARDGGRDEQRTHVSQRSRRSRSEVSGPSCRFPAAIALPASTVFQDARSQASVKPAGSKAGGKTYSTTTIRVLPKREEGGVVERGTSRVSRREREREREREVPRSMVSGYAPSVAPSDSVSSIGGKRERERLRMRMGER